MYQKREISLPVGYKGARPKTEVLGMIVTSFQDFKLRRKQKSRTFSYFLINNALLHHFGVNLLAHNNKTKHITMNVIKFECYLLNEHH